MTNVDLIYDGDCPNVAEARSQLLRAFSQAAMAPRWSEWLCGDSNAPANARGCGSPTILVDGKDVTGVEPAEDGSSCRLYESPSGGFRGVPSVETIIGALRKKSDESIVQSPPRRTGGWGSSLAALLGIGASLLPVGACPACWPAYAGLLGSIGLGFLLKDAYLFPFTALFLLVAVGALGFRAKASGRFGPLVLGALSAALVVVGKFAWNSNLITYGGIVLLTFASFWNVRPSKMENRGVCPACKPSQAVGK